MGKLYTNWIFDNIWKLLSYFGGENENAIFKRLILKYYGLSNVMPGTCFKIRAGGVGGAQSVQEHHEGVTSKRGDGQRRSLGNSVFFTVCLQFAMRSSLKK